MLIQKKCKKSENIKNIKKITFIIQLYLLKTLLNFKYYKSGGQNQTIKSQTNKTKQKIP